jgi:hypothetical protein
VGKVDQGAISRLGARAHGITDAFIVFATFLPAIMKYVLRCHGAKVNTFLLCLVRFVSNAVNSVADDSL